MQTTISTGRNHRFHTNLEPYQSIGQAIMTGEKSLMTELGSAH
jgi:hypothetical protein